MICYRRIANSLMAFLFASAAFAANPDADDNLSLMRQCAHHHVLTTISQDNFSPMAS